MCDTAYSYYHYPEGCALVFLCFYDRGESSKAEIHSLVVYLFSVCVFITSTVFSPLTFMYDITRVSTDLIDMWWIDDLRVS